MELSPGPCTLWYWLDHERKRIILGLRRPQILLNGGDVLGELVRSGADGDKEPAKTRQPRAHAQSHPPQPQLRLRLSLPP